MIGSSLVDPYVFGGWLFRWYNPDQELRPDEILTLLNIPVSPDPPKFVELSDGDQGRRVRFRSLVGASGPPYVSVNQEVPFLPGSISKFVNVNEAEVDLRVLFTADTQQLLWAGLQSLPYEFQPQRGIGTLEVINPAGSVRRLSCRCISGFKLDESTLQEKSVEAVLTFYANDPYWYSGWTRTVARTVPGQGMLPGLPVIPRPTGSTLSRITINNDGDVNGFPVFIVDGPFRDPFLVNQSINTQVSFNNTLNFSVNGGVRTGLRNPLLIDCGAKTASIIDVGAPTRPITSMISKLTRTSSFFYLKPGDNNLFFSVLNATVDTRFKVFHRSAYSTMI